MLFYREVVAVCGCSFRSVMNPFRIYSLILGGAAIASSAYFLLRRKPKSAEELERKRREWLDSVGRITTATASAVKGFPFAGRRPSPSLSSSKTAVAAPYE